MAGRAWNDTVVTADANERSMALLGARLDRLEAQVERATRQSLPPVVLAAATLLPIKSAETKPRIAELFSRQYRRRSIMLIIFHICHTIGIYGFQHWSAPSRWLTAWRAASRLPPRLHLHRQGRAQVADRRKRYHLGTPGMIFARSVAPVAIISSGIVVTMCASILVSAFNVYQVEIFPTCMRAMALDSSIPGVASAAC